MMTTTAQQLFDTAYQKLSHQRARSFSGNGCRYFSNDGNKCAVGHLLPDTPEVREWVDNLAEGEDVESFVRMVLTKMGTPPDELVQWAKGAQDHLPLLGDLQRAHDLNDRYTDEWDSLRFRDCMFDIAKNHNLTFPGHKAL